MRNGTRNRTGGAAVVAAVLAVGALAVPAGARAGGAEWTAVEGGPCDDTISVPVAGQFKQLYEGVADRWVVSDGVGTPGPAGRDGTNGTDGRDGTDGTDGAAGTPGIDGTDGTDGTDGAAGTPGIDGEPGTPGSPGERGTDGATGDLGPAGPAGPPGPPGPGLSMYSGSFPGPAGWEPGGEVPLLPAALEPRAGLWAVTFHVVVGAGEQRVDAECFVAVQSEAAVTMLPARATVGAGTRTTLSGTGWVATTGTQLVNVVCHDAAGTATGTVEGGTLNLVPVEQVDGPPAG